MNTNFSPFFLFKLKSSQSAPLTEWGPFQAPFSAGFVMWCGRWSKAYPVKTEDERLQRLEQNFYFYFFGLILSLQIQHNHSEYFHTYHLRFQGRRLSYREQKTDRISEI